MQCYHCDRPARGVCRFCGRGLCKEEHMKTTMPFVAALYVGAGNVPKAIVISDALFCGVCKPQAEPVEMPELY